MDDTMDNGMKEHLTEDEVHSIRASLLIPTLAAFFCTVLDMLVRNKMGAYDGVKEFVVSGSETMVSYFFPTLIGSSVYMLWQQYIAKAVSGIGYKKGSALAWATLFFLFFYIVYLLYADTYIVVITFMAINVAYAAFVIWRCLDKQLLGSGAPKSKIINTPT